MSTVDMKTEIKASNISCGGCVNSIQNAFEELGATNTGVNIATNEIRVEHEGITGELVSALNNLGYKARTWQNLEN